MNKQGFTIIEILFYIAISSILILGLTAFMISVTEINQRSKIVEEVEQQGAQVMELILRSIRKADSINNPTIGNSSNSLSLVMIEIGKNPTLFNLSNQTLQITEGINSAQALNNNLVNVSDLSFTNLSRPETSGIIRVQFTLNYNHPSQEGIFNYEKTFVSSASLR